MTNSNLATELTKLYNLHNIKKKKIGLSHQSLGEQVYETIKNRIICHQIKPGERIIDKHIAEELGVSRSLVRQAFTNLEKEELINQVPRSGFYVRKITKQDVEEIYDIRNLLETHATKLSVPRLTEEEITVVDELFKEARYDLEKDRVEKFVEADAALHEMLNSNCGNERLKKMINKYSSHYVFYRIVDLSHVKRAKESYYEHLKIFEAVKKRDENEAAKLMSGHIENAKHIILKNFDKYTYN